MRPNHGTSLRYKLGIAMANLVIATIMATVITVPTHYAWAHAAPTVTRIAQNIPVPPAPPSPAPTTSPAVPATVSIFSTTNRGCEVKNGQENISRGFLLYIEAVIEDTLEILDEAEATGNWNRDIEYDNDYLCWIPREMQPVAKFAAENIVFLAMNVALSADAEANGPRLIPSRNTGTHAH